jgi:hypothetical protein
MTDFLKRHVEKGETQVRLGQGRRVAWNVEWRDGRLGIVDGENGGFDTEMMGRLGLVWEEWVLGDEKESGGKLVG